jgi:hypothetical protein
MATTAFAANLVRLTSAAGRSVRGTSRPAFLAPDGGEPHAETCFENSWPPHFVTLGRVGQNGHSLTGRERAHIGRITYLYLWKLITQP